MLKKIVKFLKKSKSIANKVDFKLNIEINIKITLTITLEIIILAYMFMK